ncbi:MAG TPA: hypothetical protein V6C64_15655 [Microcoleaceae cyanobacterium]|jgi:hypothetical protein
MSDSLSPNQISQLQECFSLAQDPRTHAAANQGFTELLDSVADDSPAFELLKLLWKEVLTARRSAAFWEQISDVEKEMSERITQDHLQLHQNYLRLVQEQ